MESWINEWRNKIEARKKKKKRWILFLVSLCLITGILIGGCWKLRKEVSIVIDGNKKDFATFKTTVSEVLAEQGIKLNENDTVIPELKSRVSDGTVITVERAFPVYIRTDRGKRKVTTGPKTVLEILKETGIQVNPLDIVIPDVRTRMDETGTIKIIRVSQKEWIEKVELPFEVKYSNDDTLERGFSQVVRKGRKGLLHRKWLVTYHDGKEIKREVVSEEIVTEPVHKLVKRGTKQVVSRGGERIEFKRALSMTATAYTYTGNKTYTGITPKKGIAAVDPRVIPLGSKLYVEGYGYATAQDIGSKIKGNRIDLFMETRKEALQWGRRTVKVYVLK